MQEKVIDDILLVKFEGNIDILEYINSKLPLHKWATVERANARGSEYEWQGGCDFSEAMTRLTFGNKDMTAKYIQGLKEAQGEAEIKADSFMDTEGFAYDMGAVVSGEPECCVNMIAPLNRKAINIYVDLGFMGSIDEKVLMYRGIAVVNLIYTLIEKGYIVHLYMIMSTVYPISFYALNKTLDKTLIMIRVPIENLCVGTLAFYCSVEFFRIILILLDAMIANQPDNDGNAKSSGKLKDYLIDDKNAFLLAGGYLDSKVNHLNTQEKANDYITKKFNEYCFKNKLEV